jgi:hypothetical protein
MRPKRRRETFGRFEVENAVAQNRLQLRRKIFESRAQGAPACGAAGH